MSDRLDRSAPIAVIGAGTMGTGIAQVAAVAGHPVTVYDTAEGAAERAVTVIGKRVAALVDKRWDRNTAERGRDPILRA